MSKKVILGLGLSLIFFFSSCSSSIDKIESSDNFSILEYDSEISETLTLNIDEIFLDEAKSKLYWTQHFQNPQNNLNNLFTNSNFKTKKKLIGGKKDLRNIVQPIVFENSLCFISGYGSLECINFITNEKVFDLDIRKDKNEKYELIRGGLSYFDNRIVLVDAYGQVLLINASDGSIIWEKNIELPILSPPLIYRDSIFFVTADNRLFSISINDGAILWSFQTIEEGKKNLLTASLVAFENLIIVPFSNGELIAFEHKSGRPIWSENLSKVSLLSNFDIKDISASPVISDNKIFSVGANGKLVSLDVINGKRNWISDISGLRTPILSGNQVYIISNEGKLICLKKSTGEIYWITDLQKYRTGTAAKNMNLWLGPYLINNLIYNISYFGELKVVSPISGEILLTESIGVKGALVPPIILSDSIYLSDENSNVYEFK